MISVIIFPKKINVFLEDNKSESTSPSLLWETLKAVIRGDIISYSTHLAKKNKQKQQELIDAILSIDREYSSSPSPELYAKRIKLQSDYDLLSTDKAEFLLRRTKGTYYEYGDKASRLLALQLKRQSASSFISQIYDSSHSLTTNPVEINSTFAAYYSNLYQSESPSNKNTMDAFLDNIDIPTIDHHIKDELDKPIQLEELISCLKSMQNNKAPGPDGFPVDFYKRFSHQLAPLLLDMFNDSLRQGSLPPTLNQASISLIPKKDKNLDECGSWRPISLLNSDVKLLAKVLACRLDPCLPDIISLDQSGFVRGRQLSSNIRRLLNIVLSPSSSQAPEMVISLDAEKAFDRVEWDYLFTVLWKFGFGTKFISWIKLLYSAPSASVMTNFKRSEYFPLSRGTRQGCPMSPLLFAIAIEPLSIALKSSPCFTGIFRAGLEHRVSLYADDLLLYVTDPISCVDDILQILTTFGSFSGYKLNIGKSECFPVNKAAKQIPPNALPFRLAHNSFRYLGINISHSFPLLYKNNFTKLVMEIRTDLERWHSLPLSLIGRINSIKMNILPRFLFLLQCLPIFLSKSFIHMLDKMISKFIWAGKNPRVRRTTLQKSKSDGGLALPNLLFYYWAANLQKIHAWYNSPTLDWCTMEDASCHPSSLVALVCAPLSSRYPSYIKNPIVLSSLKIWKQFRQHFKLSSPIPLSPICNNHLFPPSNTDTAFTLWKERGLARFSDLYSEGMFATFNDLRVKYNLPQSHMFRYFQARNYARTHFTSFPQSPLGSLVTEVLSLSKVRCKISVLFDLISSSNVSSLVRIRDSWEKELGFNLTDEWWKEALIRVNSTSSCARLSLTQFKVLHKIHFTKNRLSRLYPDTNDICDRCGLSPADHVHMFFSCPKLVNYWSCFYKSLNKALNIMLEPCPLISIFGVPRTPTSLTKINSDVIAFASLIARRRILLHWKSPNAPPATSWLSDLMSFLSLEKIKYSLRGSATNFYRRWQPLISYVNTLTSLDSMS